MSLREDLEKEKLEVWEAVKKETITERVSKPELIDAVLAFDQSNLDTLSLNQLEKYMGAINQHMIYKQRYINLIEIGIKTTKHFINHVVDQESLKQEGKSDKEKEKKARSAMTEIYDIEKELLIQESRFKYYENEVENLNQLLQTIKKVYDAHTRERKETQ